MYSCSVLFNSSKVSKMRTLSCKWIVLNGTWSPQRCTGVVGSGSRQVSLISTNTWTYNNRLITVSHGKTYSSSLLVTLCPLKGNEAITCKVQGASSKWHYYNTIMLTTSLQPVARSAALTDNITKEKLRNIDDLAPGFYTPVLPRHCVYDMNVLYIL